MAVVATGAGITRSTVIGCVVMSAETMVQGVRVDCKRVVAEAIPVEAAAPAETSASADLYDRCVVSCGR